MSLCQRCKLPLAYGDSLLDLNQAQMKTLQTKAEQNKPDGESNTNLDPQALDKFNRARETALKRGTMSGDSFVFLSQSQVGHTPPNPNNVKTTASDSNSISTRITALETLFDVISSTSSIDFPICTDCGDQIREGLKTRFEQTSKERDVFARFLNKLRDSDGEEEDLAVKQRELEKLEGEKEAALSELKSQEKELDELEKEIQALEKEKTDLESQEPRFWQLQNELYLDIEEHKQERDSLITQYRNLNDEQEKLSKVNVYNDAFCIGHDGYFGTINGLRLGRLKNRMVEWSEINAAWGQTLFLLATVCHKLGFKLSGYKLHPMGGVSRIDKYSDTDGVVTSQELFSSGDYSFERILNHKKLDNAMVSVLAVLQQIGEYVESLDPSLKLPYRISKDKIGGISIRLSINASNDSWTTACKYVLTNAKWLLAFTSTRR